MPVERSPYDADVVARMYDGDYAAMRTPCGDVAFYVEEARRSGGPVLELGCGTGRVLVAVARAGVAVTGVDGSAAMLARVRAALAGEPPEVRQRVTLRQADMCVAEAGRRFALVTLPFRPIGHVLEVDRQLQLFRNARRHLLPSGRLVLDMFHPNPAYLTGPGEERLDLEREEDGCRIRRFSRIRPHLASQVLEVHYRWEVVGRGGEVREERVSFPLRWYHRFELEHLLARSGFGILELYGDFRRGPFRDDTWEMVVVAVPREPASG